AAHPRWARCEGAIRFLTALLSPTSRVFQLAGTASSPLLNNHRLNSKRLLLATSQIKSPLFHQGNAVDVR
ncbi:hypothetical protein, partial [Atlantibacter hermannii]|uniref:hypothetical protein n=1 Tax=Atlantibacter hermannii TaxID=565 RepID=UPI002FD90F01